MRKITASQIALFVLLLCTIALLAAVSTSWLGRHIPVGDLRGIFLTVLLASSFYGWAFVVYRGFLLIAPLPHGAIASGSRAEFTYHINTLFYLVLFFPLIRTNFVPTPLMRLVYLALGARLGTNTYSAGALMDPPLTTVGSNCIIGHNAVVFAHAIEGERLSLSSVRMGDDVTIGAMAIVMSDVSIADGAIVSAGSVVLKGSRIGAGEVWGGVPARCLKRPGSRESGNAVGVDPRA